MIKPIVLAAEGGALLIEFNPDDDLGWSECYLLTDKRLNLGAESIKYFVSHILDALGAVGEIDHSDRVAGEFEGAEVQWVMSLAPLRYTLYATFFEAEQKWFVEDAREKSVEVVGRFSLSQKHREQWIVQLQAIRRDFPHMF